MRKWRKRTRWQRHAGRIWRSSIAATISLLFVSLCPFTPSPNFLRIYPASADAAIVSTTTAEGRLAVFDDVWQTVNDRYYDAKFHGVDWGAQREQFRSLAAGARDPDELYEVLRRLLTSLRDAHTRVYAPEQKFDWEHPRFVTIGLSLREIEGKLTVVSVERGSEAERDGIRAGDLIQTINGKNALLTLERKLSEQAGSSTPQAARLFAMSSLAEGRPGTTAAIEWIGADNKPHQANLQRHWQQRNPGVHITRHGGIAVVTIDAFTQALEAEFLASNGTLRQARGLVFDLRNNGGGDAQAMAEIASVFLPPGTGLGQFTDRHGNLSLKLETGVTPLLFHLLGDPIDVPITILTSERTSSAAEIFIAGLKQTNHATVLGSQTCGCVLAVRTRHALPDGGELEVSELDYHTDLGVRLEGAGIKPDEIISLTRRDIYASRDRVMLFALAKLRDNPRH
ncbi:MAG: S41 family peptidase [Acidobacteriota bacterium]|nr:S41 family peptidase [Acidobacteriota bacterium]